MDDTTITDETVTTTAGPAIELIASPATTTALPELPFTSQRPAAEDIAPGLYLVFYSAVKGKHFNGDQMPQWEAITLGQRAGWIAVAQAVLS